MRYPALKGAGMPYNRRRKMKVFVWLNVVFKCRCKYPLPLLINIKLYTRLLHGSRDKSGTFPIVRRGRVRKNNLDGQSRQLGT